MLKTCFSIHCFGPSVLSSPTAPDEMQYLRFVLVNVTSLDHHPK